MYAVYFSFYALLICFHSSNDLVAFVCMYIFLYFYVRNNTQLCELFKYSHTFSSDGIGGISLCQEGFVKHFSGMEICDSIQEDHIQYAIIKICI